MIWNCCGRLIKPRTQCQLLIASVFVLLLAIAVPLLSVANNQASDRKGHQVAVGRIDPLTPPSDFNGILIMANITSVDPKTFKMGARFIFLSSGSYDMQRSDVEQFSMSLNVTTLGMRSTIDPMEFNPTRQTTYPILTGDSNYYPLDEYYSDFFISVKETATGKSVPIAFGIVGNVMGWTIKSNVVDLPLDSIGVGVTMTRGWITIFFSAFVNLTMWTLSLTILTLAATLWFRDRKVEPPTIAVASGLLFSLPAIRNTQSGAPPLGCTADVAGFFWNMPIVAFATFLLMLNYIVSYRREKTS